MFSRYGAELFATIGDALTFQSHAVITAITGRGGWEVIAGIILIALISTTIGHAIIVVINRLRGVSLVLAVTFFLIGVGLQYLTQGLMLWIGARLILDHPPAVGLVLKVMGVSLAPYIAGFLMMIPLIGAGIARFLSVWTFAIMWGCTQAMFGTGWLTSFVLVMMSWLVMQLLSRRVATVLARLRDRIWLAIKGRPLLLTTQWLMDYYPSFTERDELVGAQVGIDSANLAHPAKGEAAQ